MRLSLFVFAGLLCAQEPAFELSAPIQRSVKQGNLDPIAHLRAMDGGRFVVSRSDAADLPLENPFQAVHSGSSVALSLDGGATFNAIEVPGIRQVESIVFGQKSAGLRYVLGDRNTLAISKDAGLSWQTIGNQIILPTETTPPTILVDPRDEAFLYRVNNAPSGLFRWSPELSAFQLVTNLPSDASGPYIRPRATQLFAAAGASLYLNSTPGGAWETFAKIPDGQVVSDVVFDVAGTRRIYVRTATGALLRSNDDGATWLPIGAADFRATNIAANPIRPGHVIFIAGSQLYVSTDGGATLRAVDSPTNPVRLEFDGTGQATVYASDRAFISEDSGLTWKPHFPERFGRRTCSPLVPATCYAIGKRFENFYIEKFDAQNNLQWSSYWGNNDPSAPRNAFVDKEGDLWLNNGRQVVRIAPEGRLIDVRKAPESLKDIVQLGNGRIVAILESKVAELDPDSLAPISTSQAEVSALPPLVASDERVAFLTPVAAAVFKPGDSSTTLASLDPAFVAKALAWARDGSLLIAGNDYYAVAPRRSRVALYSWTDGTGKLMTTLQGDSSESVQRIALDPAGGIWLFGATSSQRFPTRSPLFSGPPKHSITGFATLLPANGGSPIFSSFFPYTSFPLANSGGLDVLRLDTQLLGGLLDLAEGFDPFDGSLAAGPGGFTQLRLQVTTAPALRIDAVEKRFDASGGNWSKGSWIRIRSRDLASLSPFALPVWSEDRPKEHDGAKLLLNGRPATLLGAGAGFLDAAIDNLEADENDSPALLVLERHGGISQTLRLNVDRFDFELLPRFDDPTVALCYNSDGTENSELNPAPAGSQVALFAIGSQGSPAVYLNAERIGDFDENDISTYASDYVEDVPGVLPGLRYIGLTLKGVGRFTGTRKVGLYRYYENQPSLSIWVKN